MPAASAERVVIDLSDVVIVPPEPLPPLALKVTVYSFGVTVTVQVSLLLPYV